MFDQALHDRIAARCVRDDETGCLLWQGQTDGDPDDPYGRTTYKGQTIAVHIAMFKAKKGKIRKGFQIDHKCTRRLCVEHLQEVTGKKNARLREKRKKHKHDVFKCIAIK